MPLPEPAVEQLLPANLVADMGYPLLSETIPIDDALPLGSIISRNPTTGVGSLVTATNQANVFGVLRDHCFYPDNLMVVYVSGAFIQDTLKTDSTITVEALVPRLRELGIFCRASVHYPSEPLPPAAPRIISLVPATAGAGATGVALTVSGSGFNQQSTIVFADADQVTTFVNANTLTASVDVGATAGTRSVVVRSSGMNSNRLNFIVT